MFGITQFICCVSIMIDLDWDSINKTYDQERKSVGDFVHVANYY